MGSNQLMKSLEDLAKSIRSRLSQMARQKKVAFKDIETEFLLERLVVRLVQDPQVSECIVFKGGYVALRVYGSERFTVDVDATIIKGERDVLITKARELIESDLGDGTWFKHEETIDLKLQNEYGGTRHVFRSGIGALPKNLKIAQVIHFDVGVGDPVTPGPIGQQTQELLSKNTISWNVYPLETAAAEKLHSLAVLGSTSSRSKDVFDLSWMLERCEIPVLKRALARTFDYRGDPLPENIYAHLSDLDTALLRRGWQGSLGDISNKINFDSAFEKVTSYLKKSL